MKRKILATVLVLILVLLLNTILIGCSGAKITGKYYEEQSDGTLDESSWIELIDKTKWQDDEGLGGTYEISGKTIKLFIEGEELCDGTIEKGVMIIEFFGTITYKKKGSSGSGAGDMISETAQIKSIVGGTISGLTVNLEVAETKTNVDLSGIITVSDGASWQLYSDISGQTLIPTKIAANLISGNNIYYIVVNSADGTINRTYTLKVLRKYYVTISYISEETDYSYSEEVLVNSKLGSGPSITREGYTFDGWGCQGEIATEAKTYRAKWTAIKTASIIFNSNGGSFIDSINKIEGAVVTEPEIPKKSGGYIFDGWYLDNGSFNNKYNFSTMPKRNVTVYAKWFYSDLALMCEKNSHYFLEMFEFEAQVDFFTYGLKKSDLGIAELSVIYDDGIKEIYAVDCGSNDPSERANSIINSNEIYQGLSYRRISNTNVIIITAMCLDYILSGEITKENDVYYNSNKTILILSKNQDSGFEIPNTVTRIEDEAFGWSTNLTEINIPNSVTTIGSMAFYYCSKLKSIVIPDSVTSIGSEAFSHCTSLQSIRLSRNITKIETGTFYSCMELISIIIPENVTIIDNNAFENPSESLTIYAEAETKPSGWTDETLEYINIVWGYVEE